MTYAKTKRNRCRIFNQERRLVVLLVQISLLCMLLLSLVSCASLRLDRALNPSFSNLAAKRDVASLAKRAVPELENSFQFLRENGAFGAGSKGWKATEISPASGHQLVVFHTPLTVQDYGDQVYVLEGEKLVKKLDERDLLGARIHKHKLDLTLRPKAKEVDIIDRASIKIDANSVPYFLIRGQDNYVVKTLRLEGKPVKFHQAGGVVAIPRPTPGDYEYEITYTGKVNMPGYSAAIVDDEVMLTNDFWWFHTGREPASYSLTVRAPKDFLTVAQGNLISETTENDQRISKFDMPIPVSYYSFSSGKFKRVAKVVNGIEYFVASKVMSDEDMATQLELMPSVIDYYSRFQIYPFQKWGAVVTELYGGGALEAYSYATYGTGWLPDDDAHEPAHTWYGGIVPNTYLTSFWNESFANFLDVFYQRRVSIGSRAGREAAFRVEVRTEPDFRKSPVAATGANAGSHSSSLGYGKGAMVLQQLEIEMGSDLLEAKIKEFTGKFPSGQRGEWDDFRKVCGPEWDWFFAQWLDQPGWPSMRISNVSKQGGEIRGIVKFADKPYRLRVQVWIDSPSGGELKTLDLSKSEAFTIPCDPAATSVTFDPYNLILTDGARGSVDSLSSLTGEMTFYVDAKSKDWAPENGRKEYNRPEPLTGYIVVGHPETNPKVAEICAKVGFQVTGNTLTYKGVQYNLDEVQADAIVPEGDKKWIGIRLGKSVRQGKTGLAIVAIQDKYGRFLDGETKPKSGSQWKFDL